MTQQHEPVVPGGWYPDPPNPGMLRYWDGYKWTDQVAKLTLGPTDSGPPAPDDDEGERPSESPTVGSADHPEGPSAGRAVPSNSKPPESIIRPRNTKRALGLAALVLLVVAGLVAAMLVTSARNAARERQEQLANDAWASAVSSHESAIAEAEDAMSSSQSVIEEAAEYRLGHDELDSQVGDLQASMEAAAVVARQGASNNLPEQTAELEAANEVVLSAASAVRGATRELEAEVEVAFLPTAPGFAEFDHLPDEENVTSGDWVVVSGNGITTMLPTYLGTKCKLNVVDGNKGIVCEARQDSFVAVGSKDFYFGMDHSELWSAISNTCEDEGLLSLSVERYWTLCSASPRHGDWGGLGSAGGFLVDKAAVEGQRQPTIVFDYQVQGNHLMDVPNSPVEPKRYDGGDYCSLPEYFNVTASPSIGYSECFFDETAPWVVRNTQFSDESHLYPVWLDSTKSDTPTSAQGERVPASGEDEVADESSTESVYAGDWELVSMGGRYVMTPQEVEAAREKDGRLGLSLNEDGTAIYYALGETVLEGSWDPGYMTMVNGPTGVLTLEDGTLGWWEDDYVMYFKRS